MLFNLSDRVVNDPNNIIVLDGMAGCGKSRGLITYLKSNNIEFLLCTSTHQLKRQHESNYDIEASTIAAGVFKTVNGIHYFEQRDPACRTVVIDEVLQSNPKVFDWCEAHVGDYNIFILTDTHQMLATEDDEDDGSKMLNAFDKFRKKPFVIYKNIVDTHRADNDKTRDEYFLYYNKPGDIKHSINKLTKKYNTIKYNQMPYDKSATYITHSNLIEDFLYKEKNLKSIRDLDLIQKGTIASKSNPSRETYGIYSQLEVKHNKRIQGYFQIRNIASPTRFQGSEVANGHKLYYLITEHSVITNRELYTTITRLHDIDDFVIVLCDDIPEAKTLKEFGGLPVKTEIYLTVDEEPKNLTLTRTQMRKFMAQYPDSDTIYYNKDVVYSTQFDKTGKSRLIVAKVNGASVYDPNKSGKGVTAGSMIRRDGALQFSYMPEIYEAIDAVGLTKLKAPGYTCGSPRKGNFKYQVDLSGSYPLILKYCEVPVDGYAKFTYDPNMKNYFLYNGKTFSDNSICDDILANYVMGNPELGEVKYLFSVPKNVGCKTGDTIYEAYHKSVESKKTIKKQMHYGAWRHPYVKLAPTGDCYLLREWEKAELIMCTILSYQSYYIHRIQKALGKDNVLIDAVKFNEDPDQNLIDTVNSILPPEFEWKLEDLTKEKDEAGRIIYTNSPYLPTKKEVRAARERERRANMTQEQKDKEAARKREARAKKKLAKQEQT